MKKALIADVTLIIAAQGTGLQVRRGKCHATEVSSSECLQEGAVGQEFEANASETFEVDLGYLLTVILYDKLLLGHV